MKRRGRQDLDLVDFLADRFVEFARRSEQRSGERLIRPTVTCASATSAWGSQDVRDAGRVFADFSEAEGRDLELVK